jgi:hypothetical protein
MASLLTTLPAVSARLGLTDTTDDALLNSLIAYYSVRFEQYCQRQFGRVDGWTFEFEADRTEVVVDRYPVETIYGFDLKRNEREGWRPQPQTDYIILGTSVIRLQIGPLGSREERCRITYTGGYVLPADTVTDATVQTALPADIQQAMNEQIYWHYANRTRLGLDTVSGQGGSIKQGGDLDLLPLVKGTLQPYRRQNL